MPTEIGKLAGELLKDPIKVSVAPQATTAERVTQRMIHVEADRKRALLVELFEEAAMTRTIVFTRTKRGADRVAKSLEAAGISAASIHGDKSQAQRERALAAFKNGACRAMVATDIAARGIDIDSVSHVINYELPNVPEAYVHRIGRTARAGATGQAISLCSDDERPLLKDIQKLTKQIIPATDRRRDQGLAVMTKAIGNQEASTAAWTPVPVVDEDKAAKHRRNPRHGRRPGGGGGGGGGHHGADRAPRPQGQGAAQGAGNGGGGGQNRNRNRRRSSAAAQTGGAA
jgi:ATP-dependent RNA helicase RhlE